MNLTKDLLHKLEDLTLTADERAHRRCQAARHLEDEGNYEAAREVMGELWQRIGEPPQLEGLAKQTKAEVLLVAGSLTGWIGSIKQIQGAQESAKNLLSKSLSLFEDMSQSERAAEVRSDLAYCYWREGAFDEARILLQEALSGLAHVENDRKAVALLRSAIVEKSASRYHDALRIHMTAAPLFERSTNPVLQGKFHYLYGFVLRKLGGTEQRQEYIDQALIEYAAASFYFEQAGHAHHQACVENNLGFLFGTIKRFSEAHEHLDRAQTLFTTLKDSVHLAQVDETRARVMLAEGRVVEAEKTGRAAVLTLEKGDEQSLLAEALTTHGIAQARLQHLEQARTTLERAIEVAERTGDLESAGNAALVLIEEVGTHVSNDDLKTIVDRARELLANTQDLSTLKRLANCAVRVLSLVHASPRFPGAVDWPTFSFKGALLEYEAHFIKLALEDAGGVVSRAARLLGFNHHQSLLVLLNGRHQILRQRSTPIVPRRRSIIPRQDTNGSRPGKRRGKRKMKILHVQADASIAKAVQNSLELTGCEIELCNDGAAAQEKIAGSTRYDLLLLDNDLPGISGNELARFARSLAHHQQTPIIIMSAAPDDESAQLAGANAFLRKPEDINTVAETVMRLLQSVRNRT